MLSSTTHSAADVIRLLELAPLPHEGGWFRRIGEAESRTADGRKAWSSIFMLVPTDSFSALHVVGDDELWTHVAGDPLEIICLRSDGTGVRHVLGLDVVAGEVAQVAVPGDAWQGARLVEGGRWALATCVVVPEFRWDGFQLGEREPLVAGYPAWADSIRRLTRD